LLQLGFIESFGLAPVILLALFFSLPVGLFALVTQLAARDRRLAIVQWGLPAVWVAIEYLRTFGAWAYPWNILGYSQTPNSALIQAADLGGVYAVSFVIVAVNCGLYLVLAGPGRFRFRLGHACCSAALLLLLLAYGQTRLALPEPPATLLAYRLGLVQGGLQTLESWDVRDVETSLDEYIPDTSALYEKWDRARTARNPQLTGPPAPEAELVAWPESVLPRRMSPRHPERIPPRLTELLDEREGMGLLLGALGRPRAEHLNENGCMLLDGDGLLRWGSSKVRPVPFGEVVPFREAVSFLPFPWGKFNLDAGLELEPLDWRGRRIGTLICFDNVFPFVTRRQAINGAGSFILMTNNSWYDLHSGIRQHCDMDILRAVETRRPVSRVSTTGWSHFVDSRGRITQQTGIDRSGVIETEIQPQSAGSVYLAAGDLFAQLCLAAGLLLAGAWFIPGPSEGLL
jgi:apolipoprotein N-acyltransferase